MVLKTTFYCTSTKENFLRIIKTGNSSQYILNNQKSLPYYFYKLFLNASTDKYFSPPSGKIVITFFPFPNFLATS